MKDHLGLVNRWRQRYRHNMVKLSTREVERIVALVFGVPDYDKLALRARMENLRKKSFPSGLATGRGKVASFNFAQLTDLSVALALIDAGLSPEYAAYAVEDMGGVSHRFFALLGNLELPRDRLKYGLEGRFWPMETSIIARCSVHRLLSGPGADMIRVATWDISSSLGGRQPSDSGLSAVHIDLGTLFIRLVGAIAEMTGQNGSMLAEDLLGRSEDHVVYP